MMDKELQLTTPEWHMMECLWESAPRTGRECVEYMSRSVGWSRSTTLTMLRRMTEKDLIECIQGDVLYYTPRIRREDAVIQETEHFLDRVYQGSVSMLMSAITRKQQLSKDEIDELYAILQQAEEAKES